MGNNFSSSRPPRQFGGSGGFGGPPMKRMRDDGGKFCYACFMFSIYNFLVVFFH